MSLLALVDEAQDKKLSLNFKLQIFKRSQCDVTLSHLLLLTAIMTKPSNNTKSAKKAAVAVAAAQAVLEAKIVTTSVH